MNETEALYAEGVVRTERIIERVEVVKPVYTALPGVDIGVYALTGGAGATFAAMALARAVSRMGVLACIVEAYEEAVEAAVGESYEQFCQKGAAVRFHDLSGAREKAADAGRVSGRGTQLPDYMNRMDSIIVMVDPMPSKIVKGYERLQALRAAYADCLFVLNKTHREVKRQEVKEIFAVRELYELPFIDPAYIYTAERKAVPAADICFVRKQLDEPLRKILQRVLPKEILSLAKTDKACLKFI